MCFQPKFFRIGWKKHCEIVIRSLIMFSYDGTQGGDSPRKPTGGPALGKKISPKKYRKSLKNTDCGKMDLGIWMTPKNTSNLKSYPLKNTPSPPVGLCGESPPWVPHTIVEANRLTDHCMTRHWHSITILQYAFQRKNQYQWPVSTFWDLNHF